jgi:putative FmdB family regulatory protein
MPIYSFSCETCGEEVDRMLPLSEYNTPQFCGCAEEALLKRVIAPVGFILKGDSWPGKNMKINAQMKEKNRRLTARQNQMKRDAPAVTLAPNVDGERCDSWSDAKKLAASKGKDTTSYESRIRKEKAGAL